MKTFDRIAAGLFIIGFIAGVVLFIQGKPEKWSVVFGEFILFMYGYARVLTGAASLRDMFEETFKKELYLKGKDHEKQGN